MRNAALRSSCNVEIQSHGIGRYRLLSLCYLQFIHSVHTRCSPWCRSAYAIPRRTFRPFRSCALAMVTHPPPPHPREHRKDQEPTIHMYAKLFINRHRKLRQREGYQSGFRPLTIPSPPSSHAFHSHCLPRRPPTSSSRSLCRR